ncbi:hypothetical protein BN2497_10463 [Janthinobacterium sp. CG23_2]|nr:hypothetical protein BN2497_67 [Janthinobacterium sp. CG23_2]CUI03908.1 hypothetical protein BN2497_2593 [Janthinobacterium sp. CG23_2]CUI07843.1 hypothetical protein BN2497_10463 [Janthinobacterium sp. CG23_2]CUU26431.1 hypothetical protein BN3177_67 [Janthinobacterium sp. CG23_2]CUU27694.1 hypothetical protein BN3177_2593 [Janthinobacterium sp. CG23_2]
MSAARVFTEAELEQIEEDRLDALRYRFLRDQAEQAALPRGARIAPHHAAWAVPAFVGATFESGVNIEMLVAGVAPYA